MEHVQEPPQFSEAYKQSGGLLCISPSGRLVAVVLQFRLLIRDVETLQTVQVFSHEDEISHVEWSCDSLYVLCVLPRRGLCHVWAVDNAEWYCKIDEGPLGVAHARWAPDGRHVLTSSDHAMRLTVWSLLDRSVCYIRAPKLPVAGIAFSADGRWLAIAERREGVDSVGVYETHTYEQHAHFAVGTDDLARLEWAPAAARLASGSTRGADGADASSADWLLLTDGALRLRVLVYRRDGQLVAQFDQPEDHGPLGAQLSAWAPAGRLIALGSYAGEVRLLTARTCHCIGRLLHPASLRATHADGQGPDALVFREVLLGAQGDDNAAEGEWRAASASAHLQELAESLPHLPALTRPTRFEPLRLSAAAGGAVSLPHVSAARQRTEALPKIGVATMAWSPDGRYLCTQLEEMAAVLWVWEASTLRLHTAVIMRAPIMCVRWHPSGEALAFCTGSCQLFVWSAAGMSVLALPNELSLRVHKLQWAPDGRSLALTDSERFCWCYLPAQPGKTATLRASTRVGQEDQDPNLPLTNSRSNGGSANAGQGSAHALSLAQQHAFVA